MTCPLRITSLTGRDLDRNPEKKEKKHYTGREREEGTFFPLIPSEAVPSVELSGAIFISYLEFVVREGKYGCSAP